MKRKSTYTKNTRKSFKADCDLTLLALIIKQMTYEDTTAFGEKLYDAMCGITGEKQCDPRFFSEALYCVATEQLEDYA